MALDPDGAVTVAKLELNADGFLKSAGNALVIPYIDGAYDLWLFPTEAEADSNITTNAERVADDIIGVNVAADTSGLVTYEFDKTDDAKAGVTIGGKTVTLKALDVIRIKERASFTFDVVSGVSGSNELNIIEDDTATVSFVLRLGGVVNVLALGAIADNGTTNNMPAIQKALDLFSKVYVPAGRYWTETLRVQSNQEFFGDGEDSVLVIWEEDHDSRYIIATNAFEEGVQKDNILIRDLQLDARGGDLGRQGSTHSLVVAQTNNLTVRRVLFYDIRGDGIYLGKGTQEPLTRENSNVKIEFCTFDGVRKNCRNGISVIDCDQLSIEHSEFKNIGSPLLSQSVGGIDIEPNDITTRVKNVTIKHNRFIDIDTTNTSAITLFNAHKDPGVGNMIGFNIEDNDIEHCYWGISLAGKATSYAADSDNVTIYNNRFKNMIDRSIKGGGYKQIYIGKCSFYRDTNEFPSLVGGDIELGTVGGTLEGRPLIDTVIEDCDFKDIDPQNGMISLKGGLTITINRNHFQDIDGRIIQFFSTALSGVGSSWDGISITNNTVENPGRFNGGATTTAFLSQQGGINSGGDNSFINSTSLDDNNNVNNAIPYRVGGFGLQFNRELNTQSSAPSSGTWDRGNYTRRIGSLVVFSYNCTTRGTFGTLAGATGDVTNGSKQVLNFVDANDVLRVGQFLDILSSGQEYEILDINGTTLELSRNFSGSTTSSAALDWFTPVFTNHNF